MEPGTDRMLACTVSKCGGCSAISPCSIRSAGEGPWGLSQFRIVTGCSQSGIFWYVTTAVTEASEGANTTNVHKNVLEWPCCGFYRMLNCCIGSSALSFGPDLPTRYREAHRG